MFQDGLLTAVAVFGAFIAWRGLTTWRTQLRGTHEFELARQLLLAVYKIQDGVKDIRSPLLEPREADDPSSDTWQVSAYENRWKFVNEAFRELRVAMLEAEVIWGRDILKEQRTALRRHVNLLGIATDNMLRDQYRETEDGWFSEDDFKVLYSRGSDDDYSTELAAIVDSFDEVMRPKLSRY